MQAVAQKPKVMLFSNVVVHYRSVAFAIQVGVRLEYVHKVITIQSTARAIPETQVRLSVCLSERLQTCQQRATVCLADENAALET